MNVHLIDDDEVFHFITECMLLEVNFATQIRTFTDAREALRVIGQDIPLSVLDVIFLDLNMPLMDGWQFLKALEPYKDQLKGRCRIYILTSSLNMSDMQLAAEDELVCGFIHKPLDEKDVQVILAELKKQS